MGFEYLIDLYAIAIDEYSIYVKCPFEKSNIIHVFKNTSHSLLNRDMIVDCACLCCGTQIVINIGDYTDRCTYKLNKKQTSHIKVKKSKKKLNLLYELELSGERSFNNYNCPKKQIDLLTVIFD